MLVVVTKDDQGNLVDQNTLDFPADGRANTSTRWRLRLRIPESIESYTAGTKVLSNGGGVYQCKEFPYSGYCVQWAPTATQYEHGVGSHWQDAWNKVD